MSDSATSPGQMSEPPANEPRLESWGEIAGYLRRDVRTVQRWERYQGLPVRRLQVGKLPTVYAYRSELDPRRRDYPFFFPFFSLSLFLSSFFPPLCLCAGACPGPVGVANPSSSRSALRRSRLYSTLAAPALAQ
jgi:hypothetical protein